MHSRGKTQLELMFNKVIQLLKVAVNIQNLTR